MFARSAGSQALRRCACSRGPMSNALRTSSRKFSASAAKADIPSVASHPLAGVATQLDHVAPRFEIEPSQIDIINSPSAFYETLKTKIRGAKRRIYLSTLYIGKTEHELINTLKEALQNNPKLEVSILTDALRGTREDPNPSCASLLAPLITLFGDRVQIAMYHTPNLNGWRKKYMPKRINEGWGLQHMKLYGFDDEIMLSGANLSDDYFTNRLDRYHVFRSKELADHYAAIHHAVCDISYRVLPSSEAPGGFELESPLHRGIPDPVWDSKRYRKYAKDLLEPLIRTKARQKIIPNPFGQDKTFVYPIAQFDILLGQPRNREFLDYEFASYTSTEKPVLTKVLTSLSEDVRLQNSNWTFTAGYFNIDPDISSLLVAAAPGKHVQQAAQVVLDSVASPGSQGTTNNNRQDLQNWRPCTVITASPWANGFYGSSGVSGMLPAAYTLLSRRFLRMVDKHGRGNDIQLKEWRRGTVGEPGAFTYHAKGIWITLPPQPLRFSDEDDSTASTTSPSTSESQEQQTLVAEPGPSISLIGSSNYTKRSYSLDLEVGALILTGNPDLKKRLKDETEWLQEDATVVTQDDLMKVERRVGARVRVALWLVERLGGAL